MVMGVVAISAERSSITTPGSPLLHIAEDDEHVAIQDWASWGVKSAAFAPRGW